uniref:FHA domain-containing protein n=1 Tax=Caenorhabditis tropicalis TaxID=1561998 RepID=A0A1I7T4I1_9PELO
MEEKDEKSKFQIPSWAVKPPNGAHLDVYKGEALIQKLLIDDKKAYYFGRNNKQVDFAVEHASCSRVHALLLFHGLLQRFALVDMDSSHGTFLGNVRLRPLEVVFMDVGAQFHLGASTRKYAVRLKTESLIEDDPTSDDQLDHQTSYNTAQNRSIPQLPISLEEARRKKRPRGNVAFLEEEDIINPEDVDPSVGRFRNLVTTAIISTNPNKRPGDPKRLEPPRKIVRPGRDIISAPLSSTFGPMALNAAPDLDQYGKTLPQPGHHHFVTANSAEEEIDDHHKKRYAKEAWPGRKPGAGIF